MNKIQWEKDVCFGQTPCKIRYSNLCITFGTFIIVRHLSTRIRFHLNRQHFLYGYGFRPHVSEENGTFRKRSPEWNLLKTLFSRVRADRWKRNFSKTLSRVELFENAVFACTCGQTKRNFSKTLRTHYQFKSTPRNIRNLFKMADGRFSFLSFILWLISNLISCFQANLALLILHADYSRRRQNIIRLLPLPVSRGGRLDLPLVWLCFALILTF